MHPAGFNGFGKLGVDGAVVQTFLFVGHENGCKLVLENGLAHFFDIAFKGRKGAGHGVDDAGAIQTDDRNNDFAHRYLSRQVFGFPKIGDQQQGNQAETFRQSLLPALTRC